MNPVASTVANAHARTSRLKLRATGKGRKQRIVPLLPRQLNWSEITWRTPDTPKTKRRRFCAVAAAAR